MHFFTVFNPYFDLHFKAFFFQRAAYGNQLRKHRFFALHQEHINFMGINLSLLQ